MFFCVPLIRFKRKSRGRASLEIYELFLFILVSPITYQPYMQNPSWPLLFYFSISISSVLKSSILTAIQKPTACLLLFGRNIWQNTTTYLMTFAPISSPHLTLTQTTAMPSLTVFTSANHKRRLKSLVFLNLPLLLFHPTSPYTYPDLCDGLTHCISICKSYA